VMAALKKRGHVFGPSAVSHEGKMLLDMVSTTMPFVYSVNLSTFIPWHSPETKLIPFCRSSSANASGVFANEYRFPTSLNASMSRAYPNGSSADSSMNETTRARLILIMSMLPLAFRATVSAPMSVRLPH